ncbi:MAG: nucleoside-diphosphate kinase [Kiritimatiellia bacterium]
MARELGFALINPYTIAKSRTGGVIGRLISRTGLNLAAARMFGPSQELVDRYAVSLESQFSPDAEIGRLLAQYVRKNYSPDPQTGKPRRVILLLLDGENAIQKIRDATGHVKSSWLSGESIRDTYGDYILDEKGGLRYFEPAVLVAPTVERAAEVTRLWAQYSESCGGIMDSAADVPGAEGVQSTLVMIKPDNFRITSARPGHIIDLLSRSGLRIIGMRKFSMTVAQAEEFYGPVRPVLQDKFKTITGAKAGEALEKALEMPVSEELKHQIGEQLGPQLGLRQFESIIEFMTGYRPSEVAEDEKNRTGSQSCLALIYKGMSAVEKIRYLLGSTDPAKAEPGSVRREFGSDIMVNAAHASDSAENAVREIGIVNVAQDTIQEWVQKYYGT